jgi:tetratricopeptide (TPR) repeat protein
LQGLRQESFFTKDGNRESRRLFEQAITLDPNFAVAYAHLAQAYSLAKENRWLLDREETARKALELAEKAVELDSESPQAHWALARIITRPPIRDPERALVALRRTVELDPNYADGHAFLANVLNYVGRAEESLGVIATAIRINPHHPFWYVYLKGQSLFLLGRYEEAIPNFEIAIERNPTVAWPHRFLLASYGHLGRLDDAEWEISELESLGQPSTIKWVKTNSPIVYPEYLNRYLDGLRKAGVPEE